MVVVAVGRCDGRRVSLRTRHTRQTMFDHRLVISSRNTTDLRNGSRVAKSQYSSPVTVNFVIRVRRNALTNGNEEKINGRAERGGSAWARAARRRA
ncbi:hypothetical protein EVAR_79319_1 [Eumeta japonica]|uniref:Uncharacterized protein n=1 Tax=Eumeta variegata TaxID=151549 RepID=A0A4C1TEL6_EUMVA|nr:hypothetical protein EVAR_79319_1 [Eumeta japonica]